MEFHERKISLRGPRWVISGVLKWAQMFVSKIGSAAKCFRFLNNLQLLQGKIRKTSTGIGNWRYISWKVKIHWLAPKVGNCWHAAKALGALFFFLFFLLFKLGPFRPGWRCIKGLLYSSRHCSFETGRIGEGSFNRNKEQYWGSPSWRIKNFYKAIHPSTLKISRGEIIKCKCDWIREGCLNV